MSEESKPMSEWRPIELLETRQIDLLDMEILAMDRTIELLQNDEVLFTSYALETLIRERDKCSAFNGSLSNTQRSWAVKEIEKKRCQTGLYFLLRDAIQRSR